MNRKVIHKDFTQLCCQFSFQIIFALQGIKPKNHKTDPNWDENTNNDAPLK